MGGCCCGNLDVAGGGKEGRRWFNEVAVGVRKGPWNPGGASRVTGSGPRRLGGGVPMGEGGWERK